MGNKLLYIISPSHLLCFAGVEGVPKKQMNFLGRVFSCGGGGGGGWAVIGTFGPHPVN